MGLSHFSDEENKVAKSCPYSLKSRQLKVAGSPLRPLPIGHPRTCVSFIGHLGKYDEVCKYKEKISSQIF